MNVTELARRIRVTPQELLAKLPELGFDIGARAIKVDDRVADQIFKKWLENERKERMRAQLLKSSLAPGATSADQGPRHEVVLPAVLAVRDFAGALHLPVTRVIQQLMKAGILASQNERIDFTTAAIIADELGFQAKQEEAKDATSEATLESSDRMKEIIETESAENKVARPPVVVVMGHVDHGKTRTLDAIRKTNVMEGESGGITQHIGAYQVEKKGRKITFIDTPGHEAFTVMRSRGAKVADIAILVVAADDGVQPQTKESINIIKAAKIPFVVALNKIDKPDIDVNRVLGQLAEMNVTVEEWGGEVPMAKISAKTGQGIDDLLDVVLLAADIDKDRVTANPNRLAAGTIIESHVDKAEGPVATMLVQNGTLRKNDALGVNGIAFGRVRAMRDWNGKSLDNAPPGTPVKILGFKAAPAVGDIAEVPENARDLEVRKVKSTTASDTFTATKIVSQESSSEEKKKIELNVVIKTDVLGSLEALLGMIEKIDHELVGVSVIQKGLGNVTEGDVERAANSVPSVVYGFNVIVPTQVDITAREKGVTVKTYKVIYDLFNDIIERLNGLLPQEVTVTTTGHAEVAAIFRTETGKMIVGVKVKEGKIHTGTKVRIWRGEDPIGEGEIEQIQAGKSPVKEVGGGQECGMSYKGKVKLQAGDRIEAYVEERKTRKVEITR